jgi:hypothetical protein
MQTFAPAEIKASNTVGDTFQLLTNWPSDTLRTATEAAAHAKNVKIAARASHGVLLKCPGLQAVLASNGVAGTVAVEGFLLGFIATEAV